VIPSIVAAEDNSHNPNNSLRDRTLTGRGVGLRDTIFTEYWLVTTLRGFLAILVGTAVLIIPQITSLALFMPFTIVASIVCLGAYGLIDSAMVLATSFMVSRRGAVRWALRLQGVSGAVIGAMLFALVYQHIDLHLFLYLAAIQAAGAAGADFIVGRSIAVLHGAYWRYASSSVAAICAVLLLLGRHLSTLGVLWLLYGYLGVFGFSLILLAAKMLFVGRHLRDAELK
jgi:uncharacterized membrane protein HdeD (DUF308 family)